MSAPSETTADATPLVVVQDRQDRDPTPTPTGRATEAASQRAARAHQRSDHAARWKAIVDAGGTSAWVDAELRARGLTVDEDPSSLDDAGKTAYKERKKAEAQARRELKRSAWQAYRAAHVVHVGQGVFFRDEIPVSAAADADRQVRARINDLGALDSVAALGTSLGLGPGELRYLCFHRDVETQTHYHRWTIPKRDGTARTITAPKSRLKAAQRWLLRNVVDKLPVHRAAHGFLPDRSIVTNALAHAGADLIVKVDLADFFPTVTFPRVKGLLKQAGLPEPVAILSALIATESPREVVTFRGRTLFVATGPRALPQGAPTSPGITNALCNRMDRRLSGLARVLGFTYTRYADDLTFSWRNATEGPDRAAPVGPLLRGIRTIARSEGFQVHPRKTRVTGRGGAQRVTGLVVNQAGEDRPKARVARDVIRRLRAAIHNREKGKDAGPETLEQLEGLAAFVHMVDPEKGRKFLDRLAALRLP